MKNVHRKATLLCMMITALGLIMVGQGAAQTFTNLHSFSYPSDMNGYHPQGLLMSGNRLYGTAQFGGTSPYNGMVFAINTDGTDFTNLHSFTGSDGANPQAGLVLSGNTLYGTTVYGGTSGNGTIFAINTDGTGFTNLYSFTAGSGLNTTNSDGANPEDGALVLSGNTLYGTAEYGGRGGNGTIFAINTDGTGFVTLYTFYGYPNDGAYPSAGLFLSVDTLYGTTENGGDSDQGTVFAVNTNAAYFYPLHSFVGNDGATPEGNLIVSGNTLYGTAEYGGSSGNGTIFAITIDGTGFTNLHNFTGSDGAKPQAGLVLSRNTLYGTAFQGGTWGNGTIFAIRTDGAGFTNLYNFTAATGGYLTNSDGANPGGDWVLSGNTLYGTTYGGGTSGVGTVFSLSLAPVSRPALIISRSAGSVILTWPTNATGFTLQSTTDLASPVWVTNSSTPVIVNGQNTVSNPITGRQQFFRLSQ